jgi:hypothetical protein
MFDSKARLTNAPTFRDFRIPRLAEHFAMGPFRSHAKSCRNAACRWPIPNCAAKIPWTNSRLRESTETHIPHQALVGHEDTLTSNPSTRREARQPGASAVYTSRRYRRLIQPTTVRLPAIRTDTRAGAAPVWNRVRRAPVQRCMRAMTVIEVLEIE